MHAARAAIEGVQDVGFARVGGAHHGAHADKFRGADDILNFRVCEGGMLRVDNDEIKARAPDQFDEAGRANLEECAERDLAGVEFLPHRSVEHAQTP
ncbi:MAG: hypothetical protein NVV62_13090 [Terricaulis sp.]|nr:hypothetical protein [Terricaulis sp.]